MEHFDWNFWCFKGPEQITHRKQCNHPWSSSLGLSGACFTTYGAFHAALVHCFVCVSYLALPQRLMLFCISFSEHQTCEYDTCLHKRRNTEKGTKLLANKAVIYLLFDLKVAGSLGSFNSFRYIVYSLLFHYVEMSVWFT